MPSEDSLSLYAYRLKLAALTYSLTHYAKGTLALTTTKRSPLLLLIFNERD